MPIIRKRTRKIICAVSLLFVISLALLAYSGYIDSKKILLGKISDNATSLMGQRVEIKDISFGFPGVIRLHNITIENPAGFKPGRLLHSKMLTLDTRLSNLLKGILHFKKIAVSSPELTLMRDKDGRSNISEKLRLFLTKESKLKYQVDELKIDAGIFDFNAEERYRIRNINLGMKNLSSESGSKTLIKGSTSYAGTSKIRFEGWGYLKDKPQRFKFSFSSDRLSLCRLKDVLKKFNMDAEKIAVAANLIAEGDTEKGVSIKADIHINSAGFAHFYRNPEDMSLNTEAFYGIRDNSVIINDMSLHAGAVSAIRLKGVITDVFKNPAYRADVKIERLDLSAFNLVKDLKVRGIMTSDNIKITGRLDKSIPALSGALKLTNAAVKSKTVDIENINAHITLSSDRKLSVNAEASARLAVNIKEEKTAFIDSARLAIDGTLKDRTFSGKNTVSLKGMRYGDYKLISLASSFGIDYGKNSFTIRDLDIKTDDLNSSANIVKISLPDNKTAYSVEAKDINASFFEKKAVVKKLDLSMSLSQAKNTFSGNFAFLTEMIMFQGLNTGHVSGSGKFDEKDFYIDIPQADAFKGRIQLSANGRITEVPFPIKINARSEDIDVGIISKAVSGLFDTPYSVSGVIKNAFFNGTVDSANSVHGNASIDAKKIALTKTDSKKTVAKDMSLNSEIKFAGRDIDFMADADTKGISAKVTGSVKKFMDKDRNIKINTHLPEVKVADIRDSFWDSFPDSLLYAGMDGSLASDIVVDYSNNGLKVTGNMKLKDIIISGENGEYSVGPVNGIVPIAYGKTDAARRDAALPFFERSEFDRLIRYFSHQPIDTGYSRITIGSLSYGFKLLEDITLWVKQKGSALNIERFSANIFGGKLYGSAVADISNGLGYRAGFLIHGLSMTTLGENIEPVKGYISGKVDGVANLKGAGTEISRLIGRADFWTYGSGSEKTKISREFLQKIGGPSVKTFLKDRPFDKGIMSLHLQNGFVIFKELEISNRNLLGIRDLSVKVAPFNNRISVDHLLWTITEAAQRARSNQ